MEGGRQIGRGEGGRGRRKGVKRGSQIHNCALITSKCVHRVGTLRQLSLVLFKFPLLSGIRVVHPSAFRLFLLLSPLPSHPLNQRQRLRSINCRSNWLSERITKGL